MRLRVTGRRGENLRMDALDGAFVFLETERLRLRAFTDGPADEDRLVALDGDPEVMRFLTGGRPTARAEVREQVLPRLLRRYARLGELPGYWAAEERAGGRFLGWFEFRPLDDGNTTVELGYRLGRDAWGHGYATEGSRALVHRGFAELGVERVIATTMAVNARSRRVMEKAGLSYARTFFADWAEAIEGSEHGEVEYAVTQEEWRGRGWLVGQSAAVSPRRRAESGSTWTARSRVAWRGSPSARA
jgi:RimJ/RimL family protein N-acetyltransferase